MKMMKIIKNAALTVALTAGFISASHAALTVENGILTGATGIIVEGQSLDVKFVNKSCDELFTECGYAGSDAESFFFDTFGNTTSSSRPTDAQFGFNAQTASWLLIDEIVNTSFEADINTISGCEASSTGVCKIITPYDVDAGAFSFANLLIKQNADELVPRKTAGNAKSIDVNIQTQEVFAVWSLTPTSSNGQGSAIPEPSTLAIFALGLFGLAARRKVQK